MVITDLNKMTVTELKIANLKYGVVLVINDGKIVEAKGEVAKRGGQKTC